MGTISPLLKPSSDVVATHGEGVHLHGSDGRRYLDFTSGIGVASTGHCHPKVVEAVRRQAGELIHGQYTTVRHQPLIQLAERLGDLMPAGLDTLFFASAGTESVEAALRLARQASGRANVIVFHGGFHGRTMGSLSMTTSKTGLRAGLQPLMGGVVVAPFPYAYRYGWDEDTATRFCLQELDHVLATLTAPEETAAMFVEPVLGEGGYVAAPTAFLEGLRERCDRHGILLILDEIQTGIGRTGRMWGHEHAGISPDVVITAKGLASGFPLSAFAAPAELMALGWPGSQGGTYGGNAVSCASALATLDVIESEGLVAHAAEMGDRLLDALGGLPGTNPAVGDVRGRGLMVGVELRAGDGPAAGAVAQRVLREACDRGLLLLVCGAHGQVVRLVPPLIVTPDQIDEGLGIFLEALEASTRD